MKNNEVEEIRFWEQPHLAPTELLKLYVAPHKKKSRPVTPADLERVKHDAHNMMDLCNVPHGVHEKGAFAIAHSQIDDKDPLAFFVTRDGRTIINPRIVKHGDQEDVLYEGCMSYPERGSVRVRRWHKIEVAYQKLNYWTDEMVDSSAMYANLKAEIWQHEIDHMDGVYIVDKSVDN